MRNWPALDIRFADPASDELLQAALLDFSISAIEETTLTVWRVFFESASERERAAHALTEQFPDLSLVSIDVPDEDWAARSQASLRAIQIGNIVVAPPWDVPEVRLKADTAYEEDAREEDTHQEVVSGFSRTVIVIQPSMGFGTGHHATTRLCLSALQQIDLTGKRVLDAGTGSGVLAIAASLLGAARALGIDDDPDAIQAAQENVALNPRASVDVHVADLRVMPHDQFDVVLANLTGGLLVQAARHLQALLSPSGMMILSGFMDHEEDAVRTAFPRHAVHSRTNEDEWVCVTLEGVRST